MLGASKHCIRSLNHLNTLTKTSIQIKVRHFAQHTEQAEKFGKNGHYDIIIVGGGATGISLAGAIGKMNIIYRFIVIV